MSKKKRQNYDDDELFFGDESAVRNDMAQFDTYKQFDVDTKDTKLQQAAKALIDSVCDALLQIPENLLETTSVKNILKYIENVKRVEASNMSVLMKQVAVAEHILDTLLRRLDAGGYVDNDLYELIINQQKSVFELTMNFSRYARSLPDYFNVVRTEVKLPNPIEDIVALQQLNAPNQPQLPQSTYTDFTEVAQMQLTENSEATYTASQPIRGTLDLAMNVQESISKLKQQLSEAGDDSPEFDLKDVHDDED